MNEYLIPKAFTFGKLLFQGKGEEVRTNRHVTTVKYNQKSYSESGKRN